jgi:hypothetical protein
MGQYLRHRGSNALRHGRRIVLLRPWLQGKKPTWGEVASLLLALVALIRLFYLLSGHAQGP